MVPVFAVFIFAFCEASSWGQIPHHLQQVPTVVGIVQDLNAVTPPQACDTAGSPLPAPTLELFDESDLRFGSATPPLLEQDLCSSFNAHSFCSMMSNVTQQMPYVAPDSRTQEIRQANQDLRRRVFSHANRYFQGLVTDPEVMETCCGPAEPQIRCGEQCSRNLACQQRLSQTEFRIIPGTSSDDANAFYSPDLHQVTFSEQILLNSFLTETNERNILHEFGHACQYSRPRNITNTAALFFGNAHCDDDNDAWADMQVRLPAASRCLRASFVQRAISWRGSNEEQACRSSWAAEAFANAIFAFRRTSPFHWTWDCTAMTDAIHGPARHTMQCVITRALANSQTEHPRLLDRYCHRPVRSTH